MEPTPDRSGVGLGTRTAVQKELAGFAFRGRDEHAVQDEQRNGQKEAQDGRHDIGDHRKKRHKRQKNQSQCSQG